MGSTPRRRLKALTACCSAVASVMAALKVAGLALINFCALVLDITPSIKMYPMMFSNDQCCGWPLSRAIGKL